MYKVMKVKRSNPIVKKLQIPYIVKKTTLLFK